ncbi:3-keto-5-aminohexanoate cleavage protein [Undibacterium cyanobacteriorum]|uniref:3-keto-5-aminohexanoate cleavage protein n=1 Tax=Undibacterium cyanobacteriorum TaxID=3073561 RepID=A0ABY9RGX1_9BURK|nr:3-keto-5-aminohexanoate cleavage protein [Undibacterium sp. 20NA77.5]WMW79890.1 3-keto-5-aminohexanoate cleavage protein [Undibacterium sp. 20NA77.5]
MQKDLIINVAPTGMVPNKEMSPHVPLTPKEIAADVIACVDEGASIAHLHGRDEQGQPTSEPRIVADIIERIRHEKPEVIITLTTSGRRAQEFEQRAQSLLLDGDVKPDMASLTLGSMNFATEASLNAPSMIMRLAELMLEKDIKPELEVFDLGMVHFAHVLIEKGLLKPPYYFNLLLGNVATAQAKLLHLGMMVNELPEGAVWAVAGLGRFQHQANALGIVAADGVRVGLEDNLWFDDQRQRLATNPDLVRRVAQQATAMGRQAASAQSVRERLQLRQC